MKNIFQSIRGATRKPKKEDSMAIYFEDTHNIHERIKAEYSKASYARSKHGAYLAARHIVLDQVKKALGTEELAELDKFHERRRRCHSGDDGSEESGDEGDDDEDLDEDEKDKVQQMKDANEKEKAKRRGQDAQDEEKERNHIDVEALIECVPSPLRCVHWQQLTIVDRNQEVLKHVIDEFLDGIQEHCGAVVCIMYSFKDPRTGKVKNWT
jgi:hypothetical protein